VDTRPTIMVIGATRGTGMDVAWLLPRYGYELLILSRDGQKARELFTKRAQIRVGDITQRDTIQNAFCDVEHVIMTVGVPQWICREEQIREVEYQGTCNTIEAALKAQLPGRLVYMSWIGLGQPSLWCWLQDRLKPHQTQWRSRAEEALRSSGLNYTIVRAGLLSNAPVGMHPVRIDQRQLPLDLRYRSGRMDTALAIIHSLTRPTAHRATFNVYWGPGDQADKAWKDQFDQLQPDPPAAPTS